MSDKTNKMLTDEIEKLLSNMSGYDKDSDEYSKAIRHLNDLYKLKLEEKKIDNDFDERNNRRLMDDNHFKSELEIKDKQLAHNIEIHEDEKEFKERQLEHTITVHEDEKEFKEKQIERSIVEHEDEKEFKKAQLENSINMHKDDKEFKEKQLNQEFEVRNKELSLKDEQFKNDMDIRNEELRLKEKQISSSIEMAKGETKLKRGQLISQSVQSYVKTGVEVLGIILPLAFYANWMMEGFKFEETGSFTSTTFKGLFQKFKPTK